MAFETTYKLVMESPGLKRRLVAAAAAAGRADAPLWIDQNIWAMVPLMIEPGGQQWWEVWEYAENTRDAWDERDIGGRTDVILDTWVSQVVATHIANITPE